MFIGQHHLPIESENRLTVPQGLYEPLSGGAVITQGLDRYLWVLPEAVFEQICASIQKMNLTDPKARLLVRALLGQAEPLQIDASGNITISDSHRKFAGLGGDAVIVGQGDYLEVWSPREWELQEAEMTDTESDRQRFSNLVIITSAA